MRIICFVLFCFCCAAVMAAPITLQQPQQPTNKKEKVVVMQPPAPELYEPSPETKAKMITLSNGMQVPYGQGVITNADGTCDCELPPDASVRPRGRRWLVPAAIITATGIGLTLIGLTGDDAPPSIPSTPVPSVTPSPVPTAQTPEPATFAQLFFAGLIFSLYKKKQKLYK